MKQYYTDEVKYIFVLIIFFVILSYLLLVNEFSYSLTFLYIGAIVSFALLIFLNHKLHRKRGRMFASDFILFPVEFIASVFVFFGIAKIGYDTMNLTALQEKQIDTTLSQVTDKIVIGTWESDPMNYPEINPLYEEIFSKSVSNSGKFLDQDQWNSLNIPVKYIPFQGNEKAWHYSAKFIQQMVNVIRLFDLDNKFEINNKADLERISSTRFAGWFMCFRMFISSPIVRNVWEQTKYTYANPEFTAWIKFYITDPIDNNPDFFKQQRQIWDQKVIKAMVAK